MRTLDQILAASYDRLGAGDLGRVAADLIKEAHEAGKAEARRKLSDLLNSKEEGL